jgi:hypothetical protein
VEGGHRPVGDRLALQLGDDAQRQLRADALGAGDGGLVVARHGAGQLGRRQHVEHRQRRLRADALDGLQRHEGAALVARLEAVERQAGLLAPLGLDVQHGLAAHLRQARQGARAAADHIAHAGHVDQRVLLADLGHDPAQPADHRGSLSVWGRGIAFSICSSVNHAESLDQS